jgi:hypothetical protein
LPLSADRFIASATVAGLTAVDFAWTSIHRRCRVHRGRSEGNLPLASNVCKIVHQMVKSTCVATHAAAWRGRCLTAMSIRRTLGTWIAGPKIETEADHF